MEIITRWLVIPLPLLPWEIIITKVMFGHYDNDNEYQPLIKRKDREWGKTKEDFEEEGYWWTFLAWLKTNSWTEHFWLRLKFDMSTKKLKRVLKKRKREKK